MSSACPFHASNKLRDGLPPLTERLGALPVDVRGYPVPFFVGWIGGQPEFRLADGHKLVRCVKEDLCWCCGQKLGKYRTFVIGPMCSITRTSAEPPSHLDCADWSVRGCPFLSKPQMVRREDDLTNAHKRNVAGDMIERNPGVTCVWTVTSFSIFRDGNGRPLFEVGDPVSTSWWREGRPATRREVLRSVVTGLPELVGKCDDKKDRDDLAARARNFKHYMPLK